MKKIPILYVPVLHQGYIRLLERYQDKDGEVCILGQFLINKFMPVDSCKEIRMIHPYIAKRAIYSLKFFRKVRILEDWMSVHLFTKELNPKDTTLVFANDSLSKKIAEMPAFAKFNIEFDTAFLHWDEDSIHAPTNVNFDRTSTDSFDREMMALAKIEGDKSSDWWRHVGVILVKDGKPLFETHNTHLPSEHTPYAIGDPRDFVKSGTNPEICAAIHAEQLMISIAAKHGISVNGCDIYLTTFPCIPCAKIIATCGIKRVFYSSGNAYLKTDEVLKANGVEIILVQ